MGLFIGLMSGTSMDAVDAALVAIADDGSTTLRAYRQRAMGAGLRERLRRARAQALAPAELATLDALTGECFAEAALELLAQAATPPSAVRAIGSHGQTVWHAPDASPPVTWQLGDPSRIAARTGITTVADFRRMDVALGGQGAPLAPAFHQAFFARPGRVRAVLNLGGIANLTVLAPPGGSPTGFDIGPANCLLDAWAARHLGTAYDADGAWAAGGEVHATLIERLRRDPYFRRPPPKSTGPETFSMAWLERHLAGLAVPPQAVQATLLELTAGTVAAAVEATGHRGGELLVCGGGVHNRALMQRIAQALPAWTVLSTAAAGLDPDAVEAVAFAWLAHRRLAGLAGNVPAITGARRQAVLGGVYPAGGGPQSGGE